MTWKTSVKNAGDASVIIFTLLTQNLWFIHPLLKFRILIGLLANSKTVLKARWESSQYFAKALEGRPRTWLGLSLYVVLQRAWLTFIPTLKCFCDKGFKNNSLGKFYDGSNVPFPNRYHAQISFTATTGRKKSKVRSNLSGEMEPMTIYNEW